jgi:hypothetical protein
MAETIKISALTEIPSGALDDNSVLPVVDGGVTYKLPVTKLKAFIGDSFATDAELSAQISSVNSTISGLTTTEVSEGTRLYYTDARVKTKLNVEGIISSSAQVISVLPQGTVSGSSQITITESQISDLDHYTDADVLGYINQLVVVSGSLVTQLPNGLVSSSAQLPIGIISGSQQITDFGFISASSVPSGTVSGSQQITDLGFISESLISLGTISGSQQITDLGFISESITELPIGLISSSQQITDLGFISESVASSVPSGTVSGSQQITDLGFISGSGFISSSAQVVLADADKTGFDTSMVTEAPVGNLYFQNDRVYALLEPLNQFSGSINTFTGSVGGGSVPNGTISGSQQITDFGFVSSSGIISGSQQILPLLPQGLVSSSQQITDFGYVTSATIGTTITSTVNNAYIQERLPLDIVSSSQQISNYSVFLPIEGAGGFTEASSSFSTRVSVLEGGAGVTPNLVSGSAQIDYLLTQNQLTFEGDNITILQTGNKVELTGSAVSYANVTNKPLGIVSGSDQIAALNYINDSDLNSPDGIKTLTIPDNTTITVFAATFLDDADASSVRTTLGIPSDFAVTDSSNTFEGNQTINANLTVTGSITGDSFIVGGVGTPIIESATNLEISASADINVFAQNMIVSSSVDIGDTLKLKSWNPLPSGELGMLAVSASIAGIGGLYFHNGTLWQSVNLT